MAHSGNEAARRVMTRDLRVRAHHESGGRTPSSLLKADISGLIFVPLKSAWSFAADHRERNIKT